MSSLLWTLKSAIANPLKTAALDLSSEDLAPFFGDYDVRVGIGRVCWDMANSDN